MTPNRNATGRVENKDKIILHLCASKYGSDTQPYRDAGYDVRLVTKDGGGVEGYSPPRNVYGIIANPPCTMFSIARTVAKTPRDLREGMRLVQECLRVIWEAQYSLASPNDRHTTLQFWAIENPYTGMLKEFLGKPAFVYSPDEFGDGYTKRTALWGRFNEPRKLFVLRNKLVNKNMKQMHSPMSTRDNEERTDLRSIASPYFTQAFFHANP